MVRLFLTTLPASWPQESVVKLNLAESLFIVWIKGVCQPLL